ncbi:MAG: 50S ribosomal protein L15 [Chloroflexi bacterium]|nr:50S ribosomal protein L15 [Chloroflexota bacterium]
MVRAYDLKAPAGARPKRKRVGRGNASGHGTYATKGLKGQKARSGGGPNPWFEGGQNRLVKRLPHLRGFTNIFKTDYAIVNIGQLERAFAAGSEVTPEALVAAHLIPNLKRPVKVLGDGALTKALAVRANKYSAAAKEKIATAGGRAEEISRA